MCDVCERCVRGWKREGGVSEDKRVRVVVGCCGKRERCGADLTQKNAQKKLREAVHM